VEEMIGSSFINIDDGNGVRAHGKDAWQRAITTTKKKKKATFYAVLSYINGTN